MRRSRAVEFEETEGPDASGSCREMKRPHSRLEMKRPQRRIVIVGFMAAGKTSVARALARLRSFGDHRIAMAFAVAALAAEGESEIEGAEECVQISFPEFFPLLESLAER